MMSAPSLAVAILAVAAGMTMMPSSSFAWESHQRSPSVFPRPVDPWSHWGKPLRHPPATHGHGFGHSKPHGFKGTPAPRAVWVHGHWAWNGFGWVWVPGHWVRW